MPVTPLERKKWWDELTSIARERDSESVAKFWKTYAKYLEAEGVVSGHRQTLHDMAIAVSEIGRFR